MKSIKKLIQKYQEKTIWELNKFCKEYDKSIVVHSGKLCGFMSNKKI